MRAVGLFRPVQAVRPSLLQQRGSQMMWMASRGYTVPREEATTRVTSVVKAFDKVCAADRPLVPACFVFLLSFFFFFSSCSPRLTDGRGLGERGCGDADGALCDGSGSGLAGHCGAGTGARGGVCH